MKEIPLLGSGESGKEFAIPAQRKGQHVAAYDSYAGAPAMQVADELEVFDTPDGEALERVVEECRLDITVPGTEAIHTECLYDFKKEKIQVVSSAHAVNFTMNRKAIRDLATKEPGLKIANYFYAKMPGELKEVAAKIGFPCVVKPLMSSPGKGQSLVKSAGELEHAWECGCSGSRGDIRELTIEEFTKFDSEITPLIVTQRNGPMLFCPPIGHIQKGGDYCESFQPAHIDPVHLKEAEEMVEKATRALTGAGLWGVGFFLSHENGVYFSKFFPRPYDTGMVTLAGTQNSNESEFHLRAVLSLPIPGIKQERIGASAVTFSLIASQERPQYRGMEEVTEERDTYLRIFGEPFTRVNRHMGAALCYAPLNSGLDALRDKVKRIAKKVEVH